MLMWPASQNPADILDVRDKTFTSTSMASFFWNSWIDRLSGGVLQRENHQNNELGTQIFQIVHLNLQYCLYLLVKRKSSKALASSGHIVSNFPDEACWRATGSPIESTLSRDETASFQVLSDGQAYFKPKGILKVLQVKKKQKIRRKQQKQNTVTETHRETSR